jgi:hypothetical protein
VTGRYFTQDERGASAVIVAIVVILLFGFSALGVDVARMYNERRGLQRTADFSALSGALRLREGQAIAETEARKYVKNNPTAHHPEGLYSGDDASAPLLCDPFDTSNNYDCAVALYHDTACDPDGTVPYDCSVSRVVAPPKSLKAYGFEFFFARVLGFTERAIAARAIAVLGAGAPGGERLVPWLLRDCPHPELASSTEYPEYAGEDAADVIAKGATYGCPYVPSDNLANEGAWISLFLGDGEGGNFQGGDLADELKDECPDYENGYFPPKLGAGADNYSKMLAGWASPELPCVIARSARMHAKTGKMVGKTESGLKARGVSEDYCYSEFYNTIDQGTSPDDGLVSIKPEGRTNPCLIALIRVVHPESNSDGDAYPQHPDLEKDVPGNIAAMEHQDALARFDALGAKGSGGVSRPLVVRGFGLFYLLDLPDKNDDPYRGLFMQALSSIDGQLDAAPCSPVDGLCVVKVVN